MVVEAAVAPRRVKAGVNEGTRAAVGRGGWTSDAARVVAEEIHA